MLSKCCTHWMKCSTYAWSACGPCCLSILSLPNAVLHNSRVGANATWWGRFSTHVVLQTSSLTWCRQWAHKSCRLVAMLIKHTHSFTNNTSLGKGTPHANEYLQTRQEQQDYGRINAIGLCRSASSHIGSSVWHCCQWFSLFTTQHWTDHCPFPQLAMWRGIRSLAVVGISCWSSTIWNLNGSSFVFQKTPPNRAQVLECLAGSGALRKCTILLNG